MSKKVEVNAQGIRNRLKRVSAFKAIAEYIWNGFDAGANTVSIDYTVNSMFKLDTLSVSDNGHGIPFDKVERKFTPVLSSEKREITESQHSLTHGKNGLGRLTFYHFSEEAEWKTTFRDDRVYKSYSIIVNQSAIDKYDTTALTETETDTTGTKVSFKNIDSLSQSFMENELISYLRKEFACFLEVKRDLGFSILIKDEPLECQGLIKETENIPISIDEFSFDLKFVRWNCSLNRNSSRYYCIASDV